MRQLANGIAFQDWDEELAGRSGSLMLLSQMREGDFIIAVLGNSRYIGYGRLGSGLYTADQSVDIMTPQGDSLEYKDRFDCQWSGINPTTRPRSIQIRKDESVPFDRADITLEKGQDIKRIRAEVFEFLKCRLDKYVR